MEDKIFWTEESLKIATAIISDSKEMLISLEKQINILDRGINIFRETDAFLKVLSSENIKKINGLQREFPELVDNIEKLNEGLVYYQENLQQTSVESFTCFFSSVERIISLIQKRLESARTIMFEKTRGKKILGIF